VDDDDDVNADVVLDAVLDVVLDLDGAMDVSATLVAPR